MASAGELFVCGGKAIDPIAFIARVVERFGPQFLAICGDTFTGGRTLLDALRQANVPIVPNHFPEAGVGGWQRRYQTFSTALLSGKVTAVPSLAMRSAVMGAGNAGYRRRGVDEVKQIESGRSRPVSERRHRRCRS